MGSPDSCKSCDEVPKRYDRLGTYYGRDNDYILYGYTDSDWDGSVAEPKKNLSGPGKVCSINIEKI